jgi:hypothetical protein
MKIKLTFILLCFSLINFSEENRSTTQKKLIAQNPPTGHKVYVWWKELLYSSFVLIFWLDLQKASDAKIYCNRCQYSMNSIGTYGYLTGQGDSESITYLKKLWWSGNILEIEQFLQEIQNKNQIECVKCLAFNG